jgi:hypothetical protein
LLDAWEAAAAVAPAARPLHLLHAVEPEQSIEELGAEALGRRDSRLNALRRSLVGSAVEATTECPACGEQVETTFDLRDLWPDDDPPVVAAELEVAVDGVTVVCRPVSTADLLAAAEAPDPEADLLARCVLRVEGDGLPAALPAGARDAVEAAVAEADPRADVELSLACPGCGVEWASPFDMASFLWEEVDHAARRLLAEVDVLARAYGWREPDILVLSPWRRRRYLELAQA